MECLYCSINTVNDLSLLPMQHVSSNVTKNTLAYELRHEKTNNVVFEQVRHKPSCTSTKDG